MLMPHRPIRVAVLCSQRAPGLLYLLNQCPDRGATYEIVCCVTSEMTFSEEVRVERRGIPTRMHPIREYYDARGASRLDDMRVRAEYDAETLALIEPFFADILLLDGYLYLVTDPVLKAFPSRILNLHYSDLTLRAHDGTPMFPGVHAVHDAIVAGCHETRATVHLANAYADAGAPIIRSWAFPVSQMIEDLRPLAANDVLKAYVFAHQQWMMRTASGPLMAAALRLIASGLVDLDAIGAAGDTDTVWRLDRGHALVPEVACVAH
jgi:folate-dependent phosphoribosylglycinamide formyltransferase PurN